MLVDAIKSAHRDHRFALRQQSRIDRSLESHIRVNMFGYSTFLPEADRKRIEQSSNALIKRCRAGEAEGDDLLIAQLVQASDQSRSAWDAIELEREKKLKKMAEQLPAGAVELIRNTRGAGFLGLAQIVAESGDLNNYPTVSKLWKRLGFAPYDGLAMSTWRRKTWRPRTLTAEEWMGNPFKPERYAIMAQIAMWLVNAQVESAEKSDTKYGRPKGPYGEYYVRRRELTALSHADWTPGHARSDAVRYVMKKFLRDLWADWRKPDVREAGRDRVETQQTDARLDPNSADFVK